jgi:hypothetical protein
MSFHRCPLYSVPSKSKKAATAMLCLHSHN